MGRAALPRGEGLGRALREAEAGAGRQVRAPHLLPPQELLKALRQKRRPVKRRRQARGRVNPGRSVECVEETEVD